jgi:hypothetical protein
MSRIALVAAIGLAFAGPAALAQGVAPGGPIGNSTAIGSGLGGVIGTGPSWPNGSNPAPQPTISPPPPGGGSALPSAASPGASSMAPSYSPQPIAPQSTHVHMHKPSTVPMRLPTATAGIAFLKGCWRTDVYQYEQQNGLTTWCFNAEGAGRVLYTRIDRPGFSCHAEARAVYGGGQLYFQSLPATCSDGHALALGDLNCHPTGETVHCAGVLPAQGPGEVWSVGLYRVPR